MRQEIKIVFDNKEESTQFKQIIMTSSTTDEAEKRVISEMENISSALSKIAVRKFWNKRESYLKRYADN